MWKLKDINLCDEMIMKNKSINRRDFIRDSVMTVGALGLTGMEVSAHNLMPSKVVIPASSPSSEKKKLHFNQDGKFKMVQFTDIHAVYKPGETDQAYTIMNRILDLEKPDFVIYTGDIVTDNNPTDLWKKITGLANERNIPFAVVFGNHAFQYVDWLFEGKDIILVSRTAFDDEEGGADNYHNANYLTFYRISNYKSILK